MNNPAILFPFARILAIAGAILSIVPPCVAEDEVVIHLRSNGVIESDELGVQAFDSSDEENLSELKAKLHGRRLVMIVEEDVPFADLTSLQNQLSRPDVKLEALTVRTVQQTGNLKDLEDALRDQRAAALERDRATEHLSILFDERQAIQLEKIELQMRKLETLKQKVELRAKRKAEIVAKQVEASLSDKKPFEITPDGVVKLIFDPARKSSSATDIRLRENDVDLAELKLERAESRLAALQVTNRKIKNAVSDNEILDARFEVQQAQLELRRAEILAEELSRSANHGAQFNPDQIKHMQRLLENELQQAKAVADKQTQLAASAETRYESGVTTFEELLEAQTKQTVSALQAEKLQMELEALQQGISFPDARIFSGMRSLEVSRAEAIRRNLEDSLAKLHEDISDMSKINRPVNLHQDHAQLIDQLETARLKAAELSQLKNRADMKSLQLNLFEAKTAAELGRLDDANSKLQGAINEVARLESQLKEQKKTSNGRTSHRRPVTDVDSESAALAIRASGESLGSLEAEHSKLELQKSQLSAILASDSSNGAGRKELEAQLEALDNQIRGVERSVAELNALNQQLKHDWAVVQELQGIVYPNDQAKESLKKAEAGVRRLVDDILELTGKAIHNSSSTN